MINLFQIMKKNAIILINSLHSQCIPIDNGSQIPDLVIFNTEAGFSFIICEENDILKITRISKAHGFDDISIRMAKLCDDSLVKPLSRNVLILVYFLIVGKNQTLSQFTRKLTNNK